MKSLWFWKILFKNKNMWQLRDNPFSQWLHKQRRYKICAYCGQHKAWHYWWDVEPSICLTNTRLGLALDLWPVRWRKIGNQNCCAPPLFEFPFQNSLVNRKAVINDIH